MTLAPWCARITIAALPLYGIRFALGPFPSTVLEVLILATVAIWGIEKIKNKTFNIKEDDPAPAFKETRAFYFFTFTFFLAATISVFVAPDLRAAAGIWRAYIVEPLLFFFVIIDLLRSRQITRSHIMQSFAITALGLSVYAIIQRITGFGIPPTWAAERRVTSVFSYPNAVGLFLAPLIPLFLSQISKKNLVRTTYYVLTSLLSLLAIIFAHSTGALIGVVGGLFVGGLVWLVHRSTNYLLRTTYVLIPCIIFAVVMLAPSLKPIKDELLLRDWSGTVHKIGWRESFTMLKDTSTPIGALRPILGAGLSGFKTVVAPYHKATAIEIFQYPHNILLNFWSEVGLLGLTSFIALVVYFLYTRSKQRQQGSVQSIALIAAMTVILIHGVVDVPYFKNDLAVIFWLIYALRISDN